MSRNAIGLFENRRCWVFDLDGTLTLPVHDFAFIRRELAIPDGSDILEHLDTLEPEESVRRHRRLYDIELELASNAVAAPGVAELLNLLVSLNFQLGILTRNSREIALMTLEAIDARCFFDDSHVLGRDEVAPKPDPAGILHLLDQWRAEPDNVVMVGDYLFDLQAGKNAGAVTIHVGRPDSQRWPDVTDITVDNLEDLSEILTRNFVAVRNEG